MFYFEGSCPHVSCPASHFLSLFCSLRCNHFHLPLKSDLIPLWAESYTNQGFFKKNSVFTPEFLSSCSGCLKCVNSFLVFIFSSCSSSWSRNLFSRFLTRRTELITKMCLTCPLISTEEHGEGQTSQKGFFSFMVDGFNHERWMLMHYNFLLWTFKLET